MSLTKGVTPSSHEVYFLFALSFWVCVGIGIVVYGIMIIAMFRFRKSRGAVPAKWHHNATLETVWTIIPVLILAGLAWPASTVLTKMANTSDSQMTIKVTGYQWLWRYDYIDYMGKPVHKVGFESRLAKSSNRARQLGSHYSPWNVVDKQTGYHDYLLNVDHPLVVPVGVKIRFLITGGDVIHSWWVPDLGWKMDAIPGIINAAWAKIDKPGIYRGQCTELCGKDHSAMPIVVKAIPRAQFNQWLTARENAATLNKISRTAKASPGKVQPAGGQG
ncbi:MAG TPA: cytochrome c oxidase subunit II [Rhodanobacteraceae bacterium]